MEAVISSRSRRKMILLVLPLLAVCFLSVLPYASAQTEIDDMTDSEMWVSILLVLLVIINVMLMAMPFAMVRLLFGMVSFVLSALALSYSAIPLYPYIQLMAVLISVLAMWFASRARE